MILAKTSRRRSRFNTLLVTVIALLAFTTGGFATVGVMKVINFFKGEPADIVAEIAVEAPEEAEVTRTTPQTLLAVVPEEETQAALTVSPAPEATDVPTSVMEVSNGPEIQQLAKVIVAGQYDMIAVDMGEATRIALHFRDAEIYAEILRAKINVAATSGVLQPDLAVLADGLGADADTLIFSFLQDALSRGDAAQKAAARQLSQKVFAASDARTETIDGRKVYTVRPGDSLSYIALQFYGNTRSARQISLANKNTLKTPYDLKSGMLLLIPNA